MNADDPVKSDHNARRLAIDALVRVDTQGAYANIVLPAKLEASSLDGRDRAFATELVYGVTRRRRALDWALHGFLTRQPPPVAQAALRLGAYQMLELGTPVHAAVSETVSAAPQRYRGLINAVLRRIAESGSPEWPDEPTRLSYPDWIVNTLTADLGAATATSALEAMNQRPRTHRRADGYIQDQSSQFVVAAMSIARGDLVADLCAAPGGKATALAAQGAFVVAADSNRGRIGLLQRNREMLESDSLQILAADATNPPLRAECFDAVLLDAPCTGLGTLRRRPDARWRVEHSDVARLAQLQGRMLDAAAGLVKAGGQLAYSVCTLTGAETLGVAERLESRDDFTPLAPPDDPWQPHGTGAMLLPAAEHDAMALFRWRRNVE